ncbi:MAG: class I SAM-dependent methyltransferase [Verrucomicrobia bacterium]|nr:class I SAM-dependent methyltransferase [Verrucomicrobiota bacterium]
MTNKVFEKKFIVCVDIFRSWLKGKINFTESTILDFGCGDGVMAFGMSLKLQPKRVIGVEITPEFNVLSGMVRTQIGLEALPENLEFHLIQPNVKLAERFRADCIFTWSVFEHVSQDYLDAVVSDLRNVLRDGGYVFLQISPLYYSAEGGHLFELAPEPWAHLSVQTNLLQHHVMMAKETNAAGQLISVRGEAQFQSYKEAVWSCFQTLNKVTADDILDLFKRHNFRIVRQHRTECEAEPGPALKRIYSKKTLKTEQIVVLFQKV